MNVEPEVEYRPETEITQEMEIPAEIDEGGLGATGSTTDTASQYNTANKPEVTTSATITPQAIPGTPIPHTGSPTGMIHSAGRSVTSCYISGTETSLPVLSYYGDLPLADSGSRARAFVGDVAAQSHGEVAIRPHGDVAMQPLGVSDMAIRSHGDMAIRLTGDTAFVPLYMPARDAPISVGEGAVAVPPSRMDPAPLVTEPYRLAKSPQTIQAWRKALCSRTAVAE